jgi:hypothetical protein
MISLISNPTKDSIYINSEVYEIKINSIIWSTINNRNNWRFVHGFGVLLADFAMIYHLGDIIINNTIISPLNNFVGFGNS